MTWIIDDNQELPTKTYSKKIINFTCSCKYKTQKAMAWKNYAAKLSKSCGKCNFISANDILFKKFGKLSLGQHLDQNEPLSKNTKLIFNCECGNSKKIILKSVLNHLTKSCGCLLKNKSNKFFETAMTFTGKRIVKKESSINYKLEKWWVAQSFGKLKVMPEQGTIAFASDKLISCTCKCGNTTKVRASHLADNSTKSCGKCSEIATKWWANYDHNLPYPQNLPKLKTALHGSFIEPLTYSKKKIKARCRLCNSIFTPRFHDIFLKKIKSCGCINTKISQSVLDISKFLAENNIPHKIEERINNWDVDIFCGDNNLAIDFNGLYYHSDKLSDRSKTEQEKYCDLIKTHDYIIIYEDEWKTKSAIFKNLILNKCKKSGTKNHLRPQQCTMNIVDSKTAFSFYNKYHYLGGRSSKYNIGLFHDNELISMFSFSPPSRQSEFDLELVRMASQQKVRAHGCWSYMFNKLHNFGIYGTIVSFSDNRLFNGKIYEILGFELDGLVQPDYYYTNGHFRIHKSTMRKTKTEKKTKLTEKELRQQQGWYRIWDVGKTRWVTAI